MHISIDHAPASAATTCGTTRSTPIVGAALMKRAPSTRRRLPFGVRTKGRTCPRSERSKGRRGVLSLLLAAVAPRDSPLGALSRDDSFKALLDARLPGRPFSVRAIG